MYCTNTETLRARKPHVCMSCGQRIEVGETYKRWRTYDGGDAGTNKMHPECLQMHTTMPRAKAAARGNTARSAMTGLKLLTPNV